MFWWFSIYGIAVSFAGPIAVIYIIFAGIQFINSGGDKEKVIKAKKTLTYAIIGLILILLSYPIIKNLGELTGTTCLLVGC